jgi:hypothetical protein
MSASALVSQFYEADGRQERALPDERIEELRLITPLAFHHQRVSLLDPEENGIMPITSTQRCFSTASVKKAFQRGRVKARSSPDSGNL